MKTKVVLGELLCANDFDCWQLFFFFFFNFVFDLHARGSHWKVIMFNAIINDHDQAHHIILCM